MTQILHDAGTGTGRGASEVRHACDASDILGPVGVGSAARMRRFRQLGTSGCRKRGRHVAVPTGPYTRSAPAGGAPAYLEPAMGIAAPPCGRRSTAARLAALRPARARGHVPPSRVRFPATGPHMESAPAGGAPACLEPAMGIEPITTGLQGRCSTIEPRWHGRTWYHECPPDVGPKHRGGATSPAAATASRGPRAKGGPPASCGCGCAPRALPRHPVPRARCRRPKAGLRCWLPEPRPR